MTLAWRLGVILCAAPLSSGDPAALVAPPAGDGAGLSVVQASATPILLSLLKQLRTEAGRSSAQGTSVTQWCRDAAEFQGGLTEVLQRQISEISNTARQLGLESQRLESEEQLANLTTREKQQQLQDAAAIADFASSEFASEQQQAATTIDATRRALVLAKSHGARHRELGAMLSGEPSFEMRLGSGQFDTDNPVVRAQSQQLLQSLQHLNHGMEQEQKSARQEQHTMLARFSTFADHLSSSIMETQSQMAAFRTEAAQRKREQERLDGKLADLSAMLHAVRAGVLATASACHAEGMQQKEVMTYISTESRMVAALLKQLHADDALSESTPGATDGDEPGNSDAPASPPEDVMPPPSLLQAFSSHRNGQSQRFGAVRRGASKILQMPKKAQAPREFGQDLSAGGSEGELAERNAMRDIEDFVKSDADAAEEEGTAEPSTSALRDIKQFVSSSSVSGTSAQSDGARYAKRRRDHERERMLAERRADERRSQCASILHEGRKDVAALSRSLERASAKLNINRATLLEYEQASTLVQRQQKVIAAQLKQLGGLAKGAESWVTSSRHLLRGHAEQLMALATDLNEQLGAGDQSTAQLIRDLAQKVDSHQSALQQLYGQLRRSQGSVEAANRAIRQRLAESLEGSTRRVARLRAEGQVLASLVRAKGSARAMSVRYQEAASSLCSTDGARRPGQ